MLTNKLPQLWIVWTVIVLFFVNLLNYMDRYTIAGILPEIQDPTTSGFPYKVDYMEGGLLQTSFIITFMVLSPLFGYLGDRFKRKYIMAVGIFIWGLFVLAGSFSVNYPMLLATRSLVGVGEASYGTIAPTIIADLFPADKRLRVLSLFYMAIPIGRYGMQCVCVVDYFTMCICAPLQCYGVWGGVFLISSNS
jgi:MFS family permease